MADKEIPAAQAPAPETAAAAEKVAATPETTAAPAAAAGEETTATTATGTTTTTAEVTGEGAGKDAVGVEGYEKLKADAIARAAATKATPQPAQAAVVEEPVAAAVEAPTVEPAAASAAAAESEAEEKKPERIRISGLKDGHLVAAANTIAREEGIPFAEAWDRVSPKKETTAEPAAPAAATATEAPSSAPARTRAEIEADIAALDIEFEKAGDDIDTKRTNTELRKRARALDKELDRLELAEERAAQAHQSSAQTQFETTVSESKATAVKNWPEAGEKDSAFEKRMVQLADEYEKDPNLKHHVFEADAPFFFADLVAKEMGLLPKHLRKEAAPAAKPATPTATKPAPINQRAVVRPTQPAASPASGGARTTEVPQDTLGVDKVRNVHEYDALKKRLKIPSLAQAR